MESSAMKVIMMFKNDFNPTAVTVQSPLWKSLGFAPSDKILDTTYELERSPVSKLTVPAAAGCRISPCKPKVLYHSNFVLHVLKVGGITRYRGKRNPDQPTRCPDLYPPVGQASKNTKLCIKRKHLCIATCTSFKNKYPSFWFPISMIFC